MEKREKMNILTGGMILITLGVLIILSNTHIWAFGKSWPILLIVIAVCTLIQRLKDLGGWIILAVGILFLLMEGIEVRLDTMWKYLMPVILIVIGANILTRSKRK
ncbi:MAG: DUF5668 domain-containing protein [Syntrophales bacterium]|nr:DUF5668 domain-containing protein [Syntrophales bacterium]